MKLLAALTALATTLAVRAQDYPCYAASKSLAAYERPFVGPLVEACMNELGATTGARQNPYVNKHCVAAAIGADVPEFHGILSCGISQGDPELTPIATWPSLDYDIYADIVGDCAWAEGGCPVTQQNLIDLVYGAISETSGGPYPKSAETFIQYYLQPIFDWTGFNASQGIPYLNFNDWLHYSGDIDHCDPGWQCT